MLLLWEERKRTTQLQIQRSKMLLLWKDEPCFYCMSREEQARQVVNQRQVAKDDDEIEHFLNELNDSTSRPMLQIRLNGRKTLDTGAQSVLSQLESSRPE